MNNPATIQEPEDIPVKYSTDDLIDFLSHLQDPIYQSKEKPLELPVRKEWVKEYKRLLKEKYGT